MDTYIIKKAYPDLGNKFLEIEISSENLLYSELLHTHSGCQTNCKNTDEIHKICIHIADLIRKIETLKT